jgi:hypothetical protein
MATKTRAKTDPTFIAAIARIQPALTKWRHERKHREPIPQPLWGAMVSLARRYGLSPVAQVLGVNYAALKHHLVATATPAAPRPGALTAEFVEVPMSIPPTGPPWVIELEDRGGLKLTLRLVQSDSASVLALAQGLWRHRS